jgi:hypothetical protein
VDIVPVGLLLNNDAAENEAFMEAALTYTEELVVSAEIVRLMPKMFRPYDLDTINQPLSETGELTTVSASSGA